MVKVQDKLAKAVCCLEYFTTNEWNFKDDNVKALKAQLSPEDAKTFEFDVASIVWTKYIDSYVLGFREFLFKQKPESLSLSRKKMTR